MSYEDMWKMSSVLMAMRGSYRYLLAKFKGNRLLIVSLMFIILLCISYVEIFITGRFQGYHEDGKVQIRRDAEISGRLRGIASVRKGQTSGNNHGSVSRAYNVNQTEIRIFQSEEVLRTKIDGSLGFPDCGTSPAFRSIRWDNKWKEKLSVRYDELIKGMTGSHQNEKVRDMDDYDNNRPDVPRWQIEMEKQKYILASSFQPIISEMEYKILLGTFFTLAEALTEANFTFFLYGGSHLGVFRHHGLVPWDDDIDVMLNTSDKDKIQQLLSQIPYYSLHSPPGQQWKFFETSLTTIIHKPYRWPFIDIFFFAENRTHIWDELPLYKTQFCYKKCDIFPLQNRPFEGGTVPVPCNSEITIQQNYKTNICRSNSYWHKFESYAPRSRKKNIRCSLLYEMFPFVFRHETEQGCIGESRNRGEATLETLIYPKACNICV